MNAKQFLAPSTSSKSRRRAAVNSLHREQCFQPLVRAGSIYFLIRSFAKRIAVRRLSYCHVDEQKVLFDPDVHVAHYKRESRCAGKNKVTLSR